MPQLEMVRWAQLELKQGKEKFSAGMEETFLNNFKFNEKNFLESL